MTLFTAQRADAPAGQNAGHAISAVLIAAPFLFPLVAGPSVNAWQWLATCACLSFLLIAVPATARPAMACLGWLGMTALLVALRPGVQLDAWLAACGSICLTGVAACVGAGLARTDAGRGGALAWGLLFAGWISAVLGLLQYYGLAEPLVPWTTSPELGQAYGNLRQRNQFATLLSMALVALFWRYATAERKRALWLASALLLLVAQAASTSRTGLLQLFLIVGVVAFLAWRERRPAWAGRRLRLPSPWAVLWLVPLYFLVGWVLPQLAGGGVEGMSQRLREGAPVGHGRLLLWGNVLSLIARHPWAGWGWGELGFAHYSTQYPGARFVEILDNAHNLPLHLAAELGIPAAVLICGGFVWLVCLARPWRERDPLRLMVWGVLGMIVLHSLLEYPLWYGPFQLVFGLCLGLLWPGGARPFAVLRHPWARWLGRGAQPSLCAVVLAAVVGYASWDYLRISQIYLPRDERLAAYEDDTLAKLKGSWLFARQVDFAELTLTAVTPANAAAMHALAERTLHFSPEPRVIVKLIESAELLGLDGEARAQAEHFRMAFPQEFDRWLADRPVDAPTP